MSSGALSNPEVLEVARKYLQGGGPLVRVERQVASTAEENRRLYNELTAGRVFIGEYHAQLSLDNIFLSDIRSKRQEQLDELCEEERQLDARLNYLFLDCQRLTDDNDRIVVEGRAKDTELAELYANLELQNTKHRSLQKVVREAQAAQSAASQSLFKATEQRRVSRHKLIRQHERIWDLEDTIEGLREDIEKMRAMLSKGKRLEPIDGDPGAAASPKGGAGASSGLMMLSPQSRAAQATGRNICTREDCAVLRAQLKETLARIHLLGKRQQHALHASASAQSQSQLKSESSRALSSLDASVVSRPPGSARGPPSTGRRKSMTSFIV